MLTGQEFYAKILSGQIKLEAGDGIGLENINSFFACRTKTLQQRLGVKYWQISHWVCSEGGTEALESHVFGSRALDLRVYNSTRYRVWVICKIRKVSPTEKLKATLRMAHYINLRYDFLGIFGLLVHSFAFTRKRLTWLVNWINRRSRRVFCSEMWLQGFLERGYWLGVQPYEVFPGQIPELPRVETQRL